MADQIVVPLKSSTKHAAIDELVDSLATHSSVKDIESVRGSVHDREALMSTGVGLGLGLPHSKSTGVVETVVALGISPTGINFESIDGLPVNIVFLLVGPEAARSEHIRILSWISRLMNREDVRQALGRATSPAEVMTVFDSIDSKTLA
ncbi:MAG: PTS sugar transporter subunit IIA [Rhodothermales bacterium]|nr:PTS sugar transporter subunit IIA [Rhodothermales bacterium]